MTVETIICACGRLVGVRLPDGSYEIRHRGRTIRCSGNITITCEVCGYLTAESERLDKGRTVAVA